MDMIAWLQSLTATDDSYLLALLAVILVASTIDFAFGFINARFNSTVQFESNKALYGIIKKMMYFIVLVLFMFVAFLFVPEKIALASIYALYGGYLLGELNSISAHLKISSDGKTGELFATFIARVFKGGK
ncbi:phage holin family protein [Sporosarcina sp. CAU 1771]